MSNRASRRVFLKRLGSSALLPILLRRTGSAAAGPPPLLCSTRLSNRTPAQPLFGAWHPDLLSGIADLEGQLDRHLDIVHWYQGWGVDNRHFNRDLVTAVSDRGSVPLVTWEPWDYRLGVDQPDFSLAKIARGDFDRYAADWATALREVDRPILLRFAHEMNGAAYPWSAGSNGNSPSDYVQAWRRLVTVFRDVGATNAQWVWCPQPESPTSVPLDLCFPGDDLVDVIGLDGYNAGAAADWGGWLSFSEIFGPLRETVGTITTGRPLMIAETGCAEEGGSKAEWIARTFLREIPEHFPDVFAVVWFDERREADWRLTSSEAALAAAKAVLRSNSV